MSRLTYSSRKPLAFCTLILLVTACVPAPSAELFVADRASNQILSFDETTGEFLRVVASSGLDQPSGMAVGSDGFLYVSNSAGFPGGAASVVKVDPTTGTTTPFITDVIAPGGIAFHAASNTFFVSELGNFDGDEVFRYDANGKLLQTLGTGSAATGRTGLTFDVPGNLYVSEFNFTSPGSVLKFAAPTGNPANNYATTSTTFASGAGVSLLRKGTFAGGFNGITFDSSGDLYVASLVGQAVVKYEVDGGSVVSGAPNGFPIAYPSGVTFSNDGDLLVTSLGNDNPLDPFWAGHLFPGKVRRFESMVLGQTPLLVGDITQDEVVNADDLAAWQVAFTETLGGDLDGDLDTDGSDFLRWQRGFGNQGIMGAFQPTAIVRYDPVPGAIAVPEPAAICGVIATGLLVLAQRRFH